MRLRWNTGSNDVLVRPYWEDALDRRQADELEQDIGPNWVRCAESGS